MMTGNSDETASSTTPTSTAKPVTLTSQQLQEIVKEAVAGALAQMSAKSNDGTQGPAQPSQHTQTARPTNSGFKLQ